MLGTPRLPILSRLLLRF